MPDWFPDNLAEVADFVPLRIIFLVVVAIMARQVVCWLINRSVRRAIGYQPQLKFRAAQALVNATTLPAERREQRIGALGSLARSAVTFVIVIVTALMVLAEMGFNITTILDTSQCNSGADCREAALGGNGEGPRVRRV